MSPYSLNNVQTTLSPDSKNISFVICMILFCLFLHRLLKLGTKGGVWCSILYLSIIVIILAVLQSWVSMYTLVYLLCRESRIFFIDWFNSILKKIIKQKNHILLFKTVWTPPIQSTKNNWNMTTRCKRLPIGHKSRLTTLLNNMPSE